MDDIRIYKRALSESEILGLTNVQENIPDYADNLYISPNPVADYIEIVLDNHTLKDVVSDVRIFDILGIEQSTPNLTPTLSKGEGVLRLDVSSLSPGVYFVRIGNEVRKFVKI
jgi:hypothetical protein